jgi:hypothetical protein
MRCSHPSRLAEDGEHLRVNAIAFIPGMTAVGVAGTTDRTCVKRRIRPMADMANES